MCVLLLALLVQAARFVEAGLAQEAAASAYQQQLSVYKQAWEVHVAGGHGADCDCDLAGLLRAAIRAKPRVLDSFGCSEVVNRTTRSTHEVNDRERSSISRGTAGVSVAVQRSPRNVGSLLAIELSCDPSDVGGWSCPQDVCWLIHALLPADELAPAAVSPHSAHHLAALLCLDGCRCLMDLETLRTELKACRQATKKVAWGVDTRPSSKQSHSSTESK